MLTLETIRRLREALLHDHLDGGLGPSTIVQLARDTGCDGLPTRDAGELAAWIRRAADRTSLELHLETFAHAVHPRQLPKPCHSQVPSTPRTAVPLGMAGSPRPRSGREANCHFGGRVTRACGRDGHCEWQP